MKYYHLKCNLKVVFQQEKSWNLKLYFFLLFKKRFFFISQWFNVHVSWISASIQLFHLKCGLYIFQNSRTYTYILIWFNIVSEDNFGMEIFFFSSQSFFFMRKVEKQKVFEMVIFIGPLWKRWFYFFIIM